MFINSFLKLVRYADIIKILLFAILINVIKADVDSVSLLVLDNRENSLALRLKYSLKRLLA